MEKLGIGIISLGGAGRAHFTRFQNNPKAEVVALYDPKDSSLREVLKQYPSSSVRLATTKLEEFLRFPQINVISVCSPDYSHAEYVIETLQRGLHVICEKPLATTVEDCERIIEVARQTRRLKATVHHQMRFVPAFQKAKRLLETGQIGEVFYIEADYYHDMRQRSLLYDNWRLNPRTCQNIVLGGACHPLDLMQWVTGDQIIEVFAYASHLAFEEYPDVDTVIAVLRFGTGIMGKMTMTIGCRRPQYNSLTVIGTNGTIINGLVLGEGGAQYIMHIPPGHLWQRMIGKLLAHSRSVINYPFDHYEHDLACRELIDQFLESVIKDTSPPITLEESTDVVRVCQAVIRSYSVGHPVLVER